MQKLVDALETKIAEYQAVMDTGPEGYNRWYKGVVAGLEFGRDMALELQKDLAADATRVVVENLIEMKGQVITALEADLQDAIDNDRRMQESVIAEKLGQLRIEKKTLESVLVPEASNG